MRFTFEAELWRWEARTEDWFFVSVPEQPSADITELVPIRRGFGSIRVQVTIGQTRWRTSIFPAAPGLGAERTYALPIKRAVRDAEELDLGSVCTVELEVLDA